LKKNSKKFLIALTLIVICVFFILNLEVTYYQGVNYKVTSVKIPFYIKAIDFLSRNYHYKDILRGVIDSSESEEEKALKLFHWSHENIRPVPSGFPVIDDHVWHIIIRGYGTDDQVSDVFTTLCNYAGIRAFFTWVSSSEAGKKIPLSFVEIKGKWFIFDPFHCVYFIDINGKLADIETIRLGRYSLSTGKDAVVTDYSKYITNLPLLRNTGFTRASIQSPLNRLLYEIKKIGRNPQKSK